jgi:hypothetical protein
MKPVLLYILWFTFIIITGCAITKHASKPVEDVLDYCEFVEMTKPFEIKILDYVSCSASRDCRFPCASNCIGVTKENDTVRVLSLFNIDTTFTINETVTVTPEKRPNYYVAIAQYLINEGSQTFLPAIQRRKLKTTYGNLKR